MSTYIGTSRDMRTSRDVGIRVILIEISFFVCLGHTYKLFHFVHWFQNCFLFRSQELRSSGGKFFD